MANYDLDPAADDEDLLKKKPQAVAMTFEDRRQEPTGPGGLTASGLQEAGFHLHPELRPEPPREYPFYEPSPMASALGAGSLRPSMNQPEIPYLSKKDDISYDTPLTPAETGEYQTWAKKLGKIPQNEEQDYDLRGYYKWQKENPQPPDLRGHLIDRFKKPNHPTFSDQSIYHKFAGLEPEVGGHWSKNPDSSWTFTAGPSNLARRSPEQLRQYFDKYEKGHHLIIPGQP